MPEGPANDAKAAIDTKLVFGLAPTEDGTPLLLVGIPEGAWAHMRDGKTTHLDLARLGIPLKLILYGAADHAAAMQVIETHNRRHGLSALDLRREDFGIPGRR